MEAEKEKGNERVPQPRFAIFKDVDEEAEVIGQIDEALIKLVAWQGLEKAHQNAADEQRRQAGIEEALAVEGRTRAVKAIEEAVGRVKGNVPEMRLSFDQLICALPGDNLLVAQWESGKLAKHVYGPTDEKGDRVCMDCGKDFHWPRTYVAEQG